MKNFTLLTKVIIIMGITWLGFSSSTFAAVLTEGFESPSPAGVYGGITVTYSTGSWYVKGYTTADANDRKNGSSCVRLRGKSSSSDVDHQVAMLFDKAGAGTVSFLYGSYSTYSGGIIQLQQSTDQADASLGTGTWTNVGSAITVPAWSGSLLTATYTVNYSGNIRFRVLKTTQTTSSSVCVDDFSVTDYGVTAAATPTFTPAAGVYTSTQSVSISAATPGSIIYYTVDGTTPTTSSSVYSSTPISVSTTTTIKAYAVASGFGDSGVGSATYSFPTDVADLATLQSKMPASGTTTEYFRYTGNALVTYSYTTLTLIPNIYMQDATGGMQIYDSGKKLAATYNIGDIVTGFIGQITNYSSSPELIPIGDFTVNSTGNAVIPATITLADVANNYLKLVKIAGMSFSAGDGSAVFAGGTDYAISDASTAAGSVIFRFPVGATTYVPDYYTQVIPSTADVVCIPYKYTTKVELFARTKQDISTLANGINTPEIGSIKLYADGGKVVVVGANQGDLIQVFTATGSLVKRALAQGNDEFSLPKGLYIVKIGKDAAKIVVK